MAATKTFFVNRAQVVSVRRHHRNLCRLDFREWRS